VGKPRRRSVPDFELEGGRQVVGRTEGQSQDTDDVREAEPSSQVSLVPPIIPVVSVYADDFISN